MNTLVTINPFQFHRMHRQLLERGSNRKLSDNAHQERWSKPSQQQLGQTRKLSAASIPNIKLEPSQNDVICARGRTYWDHPGNQFYRKLISLAKKQYSEAPNRPLKTLIVTEIIGHIHKTNGRFVKKASHKGEHRWVECSTIFVREKVTQSLRDGLSFKYSSSTLRKRERKIHAQELLHADIDRIVHSNTDVSHKIKYLQQKVEWINQYQGTESEGVPDEMILEIFVSANLDILETMKKDPSMLEELHSVQNSKRVTIEDNEFPTQYSSLTKTELSVQQPSLVSELKSGATRLQSSTKLQKSSVNTTERLMQSSSLIESNATSKSSIKHNHKSIDNSCEAMDLDLESPSMFLDNW